MTISLFATVLSILGIVSGGLIAVLSLVFKIGKLVSRIEKTQEVFEDKLNKLSKLFLRLEGHGDRLTRIETVLDITRTVQNGKYSDEDS